MSITYTRGDLFDALKRGDTVYIGHACNCRGVWGAGIAAAFRAKFPNSYKQYRAHCKSSNPQDILGTSLVLPTDSNAVIVCLFTSVYGGEPPEVIASNTAKALAHLRTQISPTVVLNIPMINSGIFKVPWELTEDVLKKCDININVYIL